MLNIYAWLTLARQGLDPLPTTSRDWTSRTTRSLSLTMAILVSTSAPGDSVDALWLRYWACPREVRHLPCRNGRTSPSILLASGSASGTCSTVFIALPVRRTRIGRLPTSLLPSDTRTELLRCRRVLWQASPRLCTPAISFQMGAAISNRAGDWLMIWLACQRKIWMRPRRGQWRWSRAAGTHLLND